MQHALGSPMQSNRGQRVPPAGHRSQPKTRTVSTATQQRAERLKALKIEHISHASFRHPEYSESLLAIELPPHKTQDDVPRSQSAYLVGLYEISLLTGLEEERLFSLMNLLKFQAHLLQQDLRVEAPSIRNMNRIERLLARASEVRNHIVRANLRLIVALAKKFALSRTHFEDLISEGHLPLIRAVELFDFSRGNRFSTYATWAVRNHFLRNRKDEARNQERFHDGEPFAIDHATDERISWQADETRRTARQTLVDGLLEHLTDRERKIVQARFGLNGQQSEQTLLEIGKNIGLSKERVRQLAVRALEKLAEVAQSLPASDPSLT